MLPASASAHHSCWNRASSGSAKPRRSSISANVNTTVFANLPSRYLCKDRYSAGTANGRGFATARASAGLLAFPAARGLFIQVIISRSFSIRAKAPIAWSGLYTRRIPFTVPDCTDSWPPFGDSANGNIKRSRVQITANPCTRSTTCTRNES
jgi:hypothetical protein